MVFSKFAIGTLHEQHIQHSYLVHYDTFYTPSRTYPVFHSGWSIIYFVPDQAGKEI